VATKTLYILGTTAVTPNWWGNTQEGGTAPTAANSTFGWGVAKSSITTQGFWPARLGATGKVASANAQSTSTIDSDTGPTKGTSNTNSTAGDSFVAGPYSGTFANTAWQFDWNMRASTAGAVGRIRMRVWKSANADGSSPTELTTATQVGSTVTLSTTADVNSSISWSPGSITLNNEYLFFQVEWQETTAGASASDDVLFRIGTAKITTPDFGTGVNAVVTQTLGGLQQTATAQAVLNAAASQTLGTLVQSATAAVVGAAAVSQTLGPLSQTTTSAVRAAAVVAQALATLAQTTTAAAAIAAAVAQTLGPLGQATAGTVVSHAAVAQNLGPLGQAATATVSNAATTTQPLGPLSQAATAAAIVTAAIAQTLAALGQAATAAVEARAAVAQTLGPLGQAIVVTPHFLDSRVGAYPAGFADVRSGGATYFDASGNRQTAASDTIRLEHKWDGSAWVVAGVRIEPATTNVIPGALVSMGSSWSAGTMTSSSDGTLIAGNACVKMAFGVAGLAAEFFSNFGSPIAIGADNAASIDFKLGSHPYVFVGLQPGATQRGVTWVFDLSGTADCAPTQTFTNDTNAVSAQALYRGNGEWRIEVVGNCPNADSDNLFIVYGYTPAATGNTFNGFGDPYPGSLATDGSIYGYWAAPSLEAASKCSSYIPENTTRNADSVSFTLGGTTNALTYTFDDASTQHVAGLTPSSTYTIPPASLNRPVVLFADTAIDLAAAVSQSLDALGQSAAAGVIDTAAVAQALDGLTQAAAAGVVDTAMIAETLGALGQAAAAAARVAAAVAQNLGELNQTASAGAVAAATAAQTLDAITQAAAAAVVDRAAVDQTLPALGQTATATVSSVAAATVAQTLGELSQSASAAVIAAAAIAETLGALGQELTAAATVTATVAQTLPALTGVRAATVVDTAAVAQTLGDLVQTATAQAVAAASAAQALGDLAQTSAAGVVVAASVAQTLPVLGQSLFSSQSRNLTVDQMLGPLQQAATGQVVNAADAANVLGAIVQALTGQVVNAATINQALAPLGQVAAGSAFVAAVSSDQLPALGQTAEAGVLVRATVASVLGALAQIATAEPAQAHAATDQLLGALAQVATAGVEGSAIAIQVLGALGQGGRLTTLRAVPDPLFTLVRDQARVRRTSGPLKDRQLAGAFARVRGVQGSTKQRMLSGEVARIRRID
jgi:hypothetical protein